MFAKYVTNSTCSAAQVQADIANLCAGNSIASLSASCDKANSAILHNTISPGWTLVDSAGPGSRYILSAPDARETYTKYVGLSVSTNIYLDAIDSYSVASHTGTNIVAPANWNHPGYTPAFTANTAQTYYLFVSPRTIFITNALATSLSAAIEFTKDNPLYTGGAVYPCHGVIDGSNFGGNYKVGIPRLKNVAGSGDLTGTSVLSYLGAIGPLGLTGSPMNVVSYDGTNTPYHPIHSIYCIAGPSSNYTVPLGKIYDINVTTTGYGNGLDTVSDGANEYLVTKNYHTFTILVKKA